MVVKQLPAEFKVQLPAETGNPFPDVFRLKLKIFIVVETDRGHLQSPLIEAFYMHRP
jgi:hypothetical protein